MKVIPLGRTAAALLAALEALDDHVEASDGVMDETAQAMLDEADALTAELTAALAQPDDLARVLLDVKLAAEEQRKLARKVAARAKRTEDYHARLVAAVSAAMDATGTQKVKGSLYTLSMQANGGRLPVVITGEVPPEYRKPPEPDVSMLLRILEAGEELPFAHLGERGRGLRVR